MKNLGHFEKVLLNIADEGLREFVRFFLDEHTPDYFWTCGASSSGKYHPAFAQGKGGLVRHTIAGAIFMEEVLRFSPFCYLSDEHKDLCRVAIILHDTRKYGADSEMDKGAYKMHAPNAADAVAVAWQIYFDDTAPEWLLSAIRTHMGQWSEREYRPMTNLDRAVHTADYWASRPQIDISGIVAEWEQIEKAGATPAPISFDETDLPFYIKEENGNG